MGTIKFSVSQRSLPYISATFALSPCEMTEGYWGTEFKPQGI